MPENATKVICKLLSAIPEPAVCSLLELLVQINGAASFVLIDSATIHHFVQQSAILILCAIFEGSELKVQLTKGHEFHTKKSIFITNHVFSWCGTYF